MSAWEVNRRRSMLLTACWALWPCHEVLSDCPNPGANATEEDYRRDTVSREARSLKFSLDRDESEVVLVEEPVLVRK